MRKLIALATISTGLLTATTTVLASPAEDFQKGAVTLEVGSTLDSKVSGRGKASADVIGEFGFKIAATAALNNHLALQLKHGMFKSEVSTIPTPLGSLTTYAKAQPSDLNVLYKITPNLTLITGYEHTKISYGTYVCDASKSALHIGFTGTHKLNDKYTLFATLLKGSDVSLKEAGVSYKVSGTTTFNLSYAERKVENVDLKLKATSLLDSKENYTMKGVSCLFAFTL